MISALLATALALTAMQSDAANSARRAYSDCLRTFMRASLQQRMEPAAFETAMGNQCTTQATAYRAALVQRDQRAGGSRARAEEDAQIMIDDTKANVLEYYRDYFTSNTMPDH
jgi:hypothetical protein